MLGMQQRSQWSEAHRVRIRRTVHLGFALLFLLLVLGFRWLDDPSMIGLILKIAAYTYGPLLGLFAFSILTQRAVNERWVPVVTVAAPLICAWLDARQKQLFGGYEVGLEILLINGALTFAGLWAVSRRAYTARA